AFPKRRLRRPGLRLDAADHRLEPRFLRGPPGEVVGPSLRERRYAGLGRSDLLFETRDRLVLELRDDALDQLAVFRYFLVLLDLRVHRLSEGIFLSPVPLPVVGSLRLLLGGRDHPLRRLLLDELALGLREH